MHKYPPISSNHYIWKINNLYADQVTVSIFGQSQFFRHLAPVHHHSGFNMKPSQCNWSDFQLYSKDSCVEFQSSFKIDLQAVTEFGQELIPSVGFVYRICNPIAIVTLSMRSKELSMQVKEAIRRGWGKKKINPVSAKKGSRNQINKLVCSSKERSVNGCDCWPKKQDELWSGQSSTFCSDSGILVQTPNDPKHTVQRASSGKQMQWSWKSLCI